jgi:uncharacterized protein YrrD
MSTENRIVSQELIGNPVIGITDGERIAKVEDVQIDPDTLQAAVIVTTKGSLLNRERKGIPADQVEVWGRDAILAKQSDVIVPDDEMDGRDRWLSVSDDIRGYEVVTEDGTRIGKVGDVALDHQGRVMGYDMAKVATEGRVAAANWIDVNATRSLGPDVLIVKSDYV